MEPTAMWNRRTLLINTCGFAAAGIYPATAAEAAYPDGIGTIKIIVPFAPGGASDIVGRMLADHLSKKWSANAVLEHVPGGGATVGIGRVASGPKDGSQILILSIPYVTTQYLMARLPYEPERDIAPIVQLTRQPSLLCVKNDLPVASVAELIAYAKANPGKLNYASTGVGTPGHLTAEMLKRMTGIDMKQVAYPGSAPAQNDLVGGHVDLFIDNAAAIIGLVRGGSVKGLAITSPQRSRLLPDFATIAEAVPGFAMTGWFGVAVSSGTPVALQEAIRSASNEMLQQPAVVERLAQVTSEPVGGTKDDFLSFLSSERARWGELIKSTGMKT
jgi:tripartite-type tricarboxylate transporter receptor subunit TctC